MNSIRVGVDLGGTKIEAVLLDGSREVTRLRIDTPRGDYAATVAAVTGLVARLERDAGRPAAVGIGIPGTIAPESGLVKNANSTWLNGRPLAADLRKALGRDVRIANDANCLAASEAADGAAAGVPIVFAVILGTGVGGGIAIDGHVLQGPNGIAGEWGHNPLPWADDAERPGPECYCGKRGCIETFLSGPALAADYTRATGRRDAPAGIVERAEGGDADAGQTLQRYEERLARALAGVINLLDPDVIVLGGGMSNVGRLYDRVPRLWARWVFSAGSDAPVRTRLVRAQHGDSSGVRGAACLWEDRPQAAGLKPQNSTGSAATGTASRAAS